MEAGADIRRGIAKDIFGLFRTICGRGLVAVADRPKIEIVCGRGLDMVTDESLARSGHGLSASVFTDWSRTWIVRGHG